MRFCRGRLIPAIRAISLALTLLVTRVRADHENRAMAADDLALLAHRLDRRSDLHDSFRKKRAIRRRAQPNRGPRARLTRLAKVWCAAFSAMHPRLARSQHVLKGGAADATLSGSTERARERIRMGVLRNGRPWATRALLAAAAVELFFVGQLLHPRPAPPPSGGTVSAGPVRLAYGPDWLPASPAAGLKGFSGLAAATGGRASIGTLSADALQTIFGSALPAPRRVRIGSAPALAYTGPEATAYVFTGSGGVRIALACCEGASPRSCEQLAGGVSVAGATDGDARPPVAAAPRGALTAIGTAPPGRLAGAYTTLERRARSVGKPALADA